jgi:hypothetical protein
MSSENLLDERRIEKGLQYIFSKRKFKVDTWINWEHFIFKGDTQNEEFVMGISVGYQLLKAEKWEFTIPLQNLFYHRGGQINTDLIEDRKVFTMRHSALGIKLKHQLKANNDIRFSVYYLQHQSTSTPEEYYYDLGSAFLTNLEYGYKNWSIGVGYWYGNKFVSPRGDDMFQSVSVKTNIHYENGILQEIYTNHKEPERSLFLGKLSYQKELLTDIKFGFRINTFYQNYSSNPTPLESSNMVEKQFDYSMGLYLLYHGDFKMNR